MLIALAALLCACDERPASSDLPEAPELRFEGLDPDAEAQLDAALAVFREQPQSALANARLARLLHAYALYQPASVYYRRARTLDPDDLELAHLHGLALAQIGDRDAAIDALRAADNLRPFYAPTLLKLADLEADAGDVEASRAFYEAALQSVPDLPQALLGLGKLLLEVEPERARRLMRRAATVGGSYGAAHYALAPLLRDDGEVEAARDELAAFERLRNQAPYLDDPILARVRLLNNSRNGHLERALNAYREGRMEASAREFEKSLEKDPDNTMARQNLIAVYAQLGRYDDAESHYRLGVQTDPDVVKLHTNYALLQLQQRHYAKAIEAYETAIQVDPGYGKSYVGIGAIHETKGERSLAIDWYRKAIENDPESRQARQYLATALIERGTYAEAIAEITPTITPDDVQTAMSLRILAKAQAAAQRYDDAEKSLLRADSLARRFQRFDIARSAREDVDTVRMARAMAEGK